MSAWTDGNSEVLLGDRGLSVQQDDETRLLLSVEQLGGPLPAQKGHTRLRPLAVSLGAKFVFTATTERKLVRTSVRSTGKNVLFPWDISDIAPAPGQRVFAAYVTGTKARAMTSIVWGAPPPDPKGKWEHEYESTKPKKVAWPEDLLWEKPQWSRKTRWTVNPDELILDVNEHAYVVYDLASAVVGVLRRQDPKQGPEGFACILRTPMDKGTSFAATATARGVVVATCKGDGQAALSEFDDEGKHLGHRVIEAKQIGALVLAGERLFVLVEQHKLLILGLDLQPQATLELPSLPPSQTVLRSNPEGTCFVLAVADKVLRGQLEAGTWSLGEIDLSDVPEPDDEHQTPIPEAEIVESATPAGANSKDGGRVRIITQAPRLSLNPEQPNDAWSFPASDSFEIALNAVSVGGPAETGLYIEVSGDALDKGLLEPESVAIEGLNVGQAPFVVTGKTRRALLPDFRVPAGVEPIKDRKIKPKERFLENPEDTFLTVRLHCKSLAAGSELVFVRVGFVGTEEGKLMRGRPLKIN